MAHRGSHDVWRARASLAQVRRSPWSSKHAELDRQHLTEYGRSHDNGQPVVHVRNEEGLDVDYRIVVSVAGKPRDSRRPYACPDGAEWSTTIAAPPGLKSP